MNGPGPLASIRVVLARPSHPGNIGSAARAMGTMGLDALFLVQPRRFPDPECDALASGARGVLEAATVCETLEDALAGTVMTAGFSARHRELQHRTLDVREAAQELVAGARRGPVALVFGNESWGLSAEEAQRCQLLVRIPANPDYSSLNLAAAVQVAAYELRMAALALSPASLPGGERHDALLSRRERSRGEGRGEAEVPEGEPATFEDLEALVAHFERVMTATGFHNPDVPKRLMPRLRRLFARARLEREEVNILRGFLKSAEEVERQAGVKHT